MEETPRNLHPKFIERKIRSSEDYRSRPICVTPISISLTKLLSGLVLSVDVQLFSMCDND